MTNNKLYRCTHSASSLCTKGHLSEEVIYLIFQHMDWDPIAIAAFSGSCIWFDDFAKRVLWKEFCITRAPKMIRDLESGESDTIYRNWRALGKLLVYCLGCENGHSVNHARYSKTSGKCFLLRQCRSTDVLYVSDPCEHLDQGEEGSVGFFRGVFKAFSTSETKKMLIKERAPLHPRDVCPYCKAKLWSMKQAEMIPLSASYKVGAYENCIEYYVCLSGHLLGACTLLPLTDSEEASGVE